MRDHQLISISDFNGLFDRGIDDAVPQNSFLQADNVHYFEGEVQSRYGTSLDFSTVTNIVRAELYKRTGEATRLIVLKNDGNFYDSSAPSSPILTVANAVDFQMVTFFNRAYITPIASTGQGVSGSFIYVYDGTGVARKAAGTAPTGTLSVAESALSGSVEAGYHLFAVAFETASGFISKPGPLVYGIIEASGSLKIDLSGVPTGPTGTTKRHILATRSILEYDGNQNGYEFFFVPSGIIANNSATTITVDFYDADLFSSAEYLFDQYEELDAAAGISQYKGRLIYWSANYIYVSKVGEPESVDALAGLILVNPTESSYVKNCTEYRDALYIDKQYGSYVTQDNGSDPGTWIVVAVDKGTGSSARGTIRILDTQGTSIDKFLLCTIRGLVLFNGVYGKPELTYKIEEVWKRINKTYFDLVHGCNDPVNNNIYISVPLDAATSCSHILVGNYSKGLDPVNIRWSIWSSAVWNPTSILIDLATDTPYLRIASSAGVYSVSSSSRQDAGQAITSTLKTALVPTASGALGHYSQVALRAKGSGTLSLTLYSEDDQANQSLTSVTLSSTPGKEYRVLSNFINEKAALRIQITTINHWFSINRIDLHAKVLWASRVL